MLTFGEDLHKSDYNDSQNQQVSSATLSPSKRERAHAHTHVIKSQPLKEDALQPTFQIDPFKDANVILPEMKKNLAIFINRSSHVDTVQALNIIKAFRINKERKKRLGDVHIHLKILDCSLSLEAEPKAERDLVHGINTGA